MTHFRIKPAQKSGFTLIELLIVIAIIAILALIAIPNFLEAQTRSKVARAMADMRSIATAMEAYQVDYNCYIWSAHDNSGSPDSGATWNTPKDIFWWYSRLTTPVAFLTTISRDPFSKPDIAVKGQQFFNTYTGNEFDQVTGVRTAFVVMSMGPGKQNTVWNLHYPSGIPKAEASFLQPTDIIHGPHSNTSGLAYDPSNGTISAGNIFRLSTPIQLFLVR